MDRRGIPPDGYTYASLLRTGVNIRFITACKLVHAISFQPDSNRTCLRKSSSSPCMLKRKIGRCPESFRAKGRTRSLIMVACSHRAADNAQRATSDAQASRADEDHVWWRRSVLCGDQLVSSSLAGVQKPLIVRFSTVIHERGSPETLRDPRGFAVKFYTREGNFDLVGNNFPVFFVRDGMKFPDMVHALKPNPKSHIQEDWRILDFFSHHPESLHMFTFLFDDLGIPLNYRHMDGSGVHTFTLVNKAGRQTYVKFHWRPTCGVKCLLDDEAVVVGGTNHSHATKDLYDSIAAGNYPEWKLFIQTMDPRDEDKYDFDPLDVTKYWPEDIFPLQPVGRMVLNKNIDNFFAENEQLAFGPGLVVPGVYYTEDKLLQTRIFSYSDTQRHRLGPNYLMLPANAPKCAHHNNHHEGFMNFMHRDEEVNYFPSRFDPVRHAERFPIPSHTHTGKREKCVIEKENNFKQPGERYRTFAPDRQERFVKRWVAALSDPRVTHEICSVWISYWSQCDKSLGQKIAARLNMKANM